MHEKRSTILVVDDEADIQKMLSVLLEAENFKIVSGESGKQALRMVESLKPDLILLDLELPDMSGKDVVKILRVSTQVPVIMLSTHSSDEEAAGVLNAGANDYMTKPFNFDVLLARINASLRSSIVRETGETELCNGMIRMDLVRHEVFVNDTLTGFTPKEYDLLRYFIVNRGKMLTHRDILKTVWGAAHIDDTTYLRVYIGQIREKIRDGMDSPLLITTKQGIGYRMEILPNVMMHHAKVADSIHAP